MRPKSVPSSHLETLLERACRDQILQSIECDEARGSQEDREGQQAPAVSRVEFIGDVGCMAEAVQQGLGRGVLRNGSACGARAPKGRLPLCFDPGCVMSSDESYWISLEGECQMRGPDVLGPSNTESMIEKASGTKHKYSTRS